MTDTFPPNTTSELISTTDYNPVVLARDVTAADYLEHYAAHHTEWQAGEVISMTPIHDRHVQIDNYLRYLFGAYFEQKPIGTFKPEPFVMRLDAVPAYREPDIQVILGDNQQNLTPTYMNGAADICVEIVSPESVTRDYQTKLAEYETVGVREYWIIDPERQQAVFHRLDENGSYSEIYRNGDYTTPLLPCFIFHTDNLWQDPLPGISVVVSSVVAMIARCKETLAT